MDETQIEAIYERIWETHDGDLYRKLDESLSPRPPEMLYDVVARLGLRPGSLVLDAGCGSGNHTCALARRFGFHVKGLDLSESNLKTAREAASKEELTGQVEFLRGDIERLPFDDATFDFVWCRDMLLHVPNLARALDEWGRVLKPGGQALVFTTLATDLLEAGEAARLFPTLAVVLENLSRSRVESLFKAAGLEIVSTEIIGSELSEFYDERDGRYARELMRIARMRRAREKFIVELGRENYDLALALYYWGVYHLLGKLESAVYVLRKAGGH
jgi:SAM-dependent methyltransferase